GMDFCSLATARSVPIAQRLALALAPNEREIGDLQIKISGCINACGHHHVGHIGLLGVDKNGEEFYQISLGGRADATAALGQIIGPAVKSDDVVPAVERVVAQFLALRQPDERFPETYARVGAQPFKEALYAAH
ncbi:MAG: nitrite/sulfite reductase, partial [Stellaceae bacterium]